MSDLTQVLHDCAKVVPSQLHGYLNDFQTLYDKRLWHQLTERVQQFFNEPSANSSLPTVFSKFVLPWHKKMNQVIYVKLAVITAAFTSPQEAIKLLEDIKEEMRNLPQPEAPALAVLATMEAAHYRVRTGDLVATKKAIDDCSENAESMAAVDPAIPASFFRVCADYDKATLSFANFYRNSLLYLSCVRVEDIPLAEAQERAHDLCVSALLGDTIYNFGELLFHPILLVLKNTQFQYLAETLLALNSGNLPSFEKLLATLGQHPTLNNRVEFLKQKAYLMTLVETLFRHLKNSRIIRFDEISQATKVPLGQVEFLLMKALSLRLIRGTLNEPNQVFTIEWVQPRALDKTQIIELRSAIQVWRQRVQNTSRLINDLVPAPLSSLTETI